MNYPTDYKPIAFTSATKHRTGGLVSTEKPRRPLQPCDAREMILKPFFLAKLAVEEAELLRYLIFKPNDRTFIKPSRMLKEGIEMVRKSLEHNMTEAETKLMNFLMFRYKEDLKTVITQLRMQTSQYLKSSNPDAEDVEANAQSEVMRFFTAIALEMSLSCTARLVAANATVPLKVDKWTANGLVKLREAGLEVENISLISQTREISKVRKDNLDRALEAVLRTINNTDIAQGDKFTCCGVCQHFFWGDWYKSHCLWRNYKAEPMRPACKRFKRVQEKD